MREDKGKLITIWNPSLHGVGSSTIASAVGFGLQYYTEKYGISKKVLILNNCESLSYMEKYIEGDVKIKYTKDNLKVYNGNLSKENVETFANPINENLKMIAGSKLRKDITKEDEKFEERYLEKCLESADIVVADITTGIREDNEIYLKKADIIIAVISPNEIMLDELYGENSGAKVHEYLRSERTITVINKLFEKWDIDKEAQYLSKKYGMGVTFGIINDGNVYKACCSKKKFYSHMINEFKQERDPFAEQIMNIAWYIIDNLFVQLEPVEKEEGGIIGKIKKKLRL